MKIACTIAALVIGGTLSTMASAAPLGGKAPADGQSLINKAAFVCVRDDRGWHYMRASKRVVCRPVRPKGALWGWKCEGPRCGWWHRNEHRWHDAG